MYVCVRARVGERESVCVCEVLGLHGRRLMLTFACNACNARAYPLVQPVKEFIAENSHPIHNPEDAVPVVHEFLEGLQDKVAQHELWKVCACVCV